MKVILESQRLTLRELNLSDAAFIQKIVNTKDFLTYIGDKKVFDRQSAEHYIQSGPAQSYKTHGFGLWLMQLKSDKQPIGLCGLLKRDTLEDVDVGFAVMPKHYRKGYTFEAAKACLDYGRHKLGIQKIVGITDSANTASIQLLNKLGMQYRKTIPFSENGTALLLEPFVAKSDLEQINSLINKYFGIFNNINNSSLDISQLRKLTIKECHIINNTGSEPLIYDLDSFISSRQKMLTDGTLTEFSENEISHQTHIFDKIAQRFCLYEKSGGLNGKAFDGKGMKTIQLIKISNEWKISAVTWSDQNI